MKQRDRGETGSSVPVALMLQNNWWRQNVRPVLPSSQNKKNEKDDTRGCIFFLDNITLLSLDDILYKGKLPCAAPFNIVLSERVLNRRFSCNDNGMRGWSYEIPGTQWQSRGR